MPTAAENIILIARLAKRQGACPNDDAAKAGAHVLDGLHKHIDVYKLEAILQQIIVIRTGDLH
ncbi:hypothetical protein KIN20_003496 [Parelaphostrongylus tenuis]|uniref:Uncharacterized protein n=1 Tax=Parelaphostrongylus tenuis TaxID=148309 RepID=A0AAD5LXD7_PARTN|nr:hypothetical protein KIN20_003496 [Parelaphostrongylus tenuis]